MKTYGAAWLAVALAVIAAIYFMQAWWTMFFFILPFCISLVGLAVQVGKKEDKEV